MENEIWVECYEFPNYEVSNLGRIRNVRTKRILKNGFDGNSYRIVRIWYQGRKYTRRLGKLIWQSFNNCRCNETVDHINREHNDDRIVNLRCIPQKMQYENKKNVPKGNKYNLTNEIRGEIVKRYNEGTTVYRLVKDYKLPYNYIRESLRRKNWVKYL